MNTRTQLTRPTLSRRQAGFSLIEALVALLVVAFGMLGIASFQYTLSRSSDVAKQRTEATRIAQKELDRLRSFAQRQSDGNPADDRYSYVDDLRSSAGAQAVTGLATNTTYNLEREVFIQTRDQTPLPGAAAAFDQVLSSGLTASGGTPTGDKFRLFNVVVSWEDRAGQRQEVRLASSISDGDPSALGALGVMRRTSTTLRPRNRNINIPFASVLLSGGSTSAFAAPAGNAVFVIDNLTGQVTQRCENVTAPLIEGIDLVASGATCVTIDAYLLSGYVRFKITGDAATASNISNPNLLTDEPRPLLSTLFSTDTPPVVTQQPVRISEYECYSQIRFTARRVGFPDLDLVEGEALPTGYVGSGVPHYIAYACIVTPIDHDGVASTPRIWSGEVTLRPSGWRFDDSGDLEERDDDRDSRRGRGRDDRGRSCRFTSDYNGNTALSNNEHPRYYRQVSGALSNQNFLVVNGRDACPTDVAFDSANGDFVDTNTATHQPSDRAQLSFRCSTAACSGGNKVTMEPSLPAIAIPME
jgi:type IV pilus modification protein PilV